jgi:NAD(P)H dehydrogenase (quinone)
MVMVGLPYSEPDLAKTSTGGTPYGPSHVSGHDGNQPLSDEESRLCIALGKRVAEMATKLNA